MSRPKTLPLVALLLQSPVLTHFGILHAEDNKIRHVMVIGIDGMHALDMALWVKRNQTSAMAGAGACAPGELRN